MAGTRSIAKKVLPLSMQRAKAHSLPPLPGTTPITAEEVREAFGTKNVEVFTESEALQAAVSRQLSAVSAQNVALLMMSSGTFDGIDVKEFCVKLLNG